MEDVLYVALLTPKKTPSKYYLVGFHLYLPMGYVDSSPYLCIATKTIADLVNKTIYQRDSASKHPLERAAETKVADGAGESEAQANTSWEQLPADQRSAATANTDIYMDDLISIV